MTFKVNKNWIPAIAHCHELLVSVFKLFYELSATCATERMSPTEIEELTQNLLTRDGDSLVEINYTVLSTGSRRHSVADLSAKLTIREKADWARSQTSKVRQLSADLREITTAKQVEAIANQFVWALRRPTPLEQKRAIKRIPHTIWIDTRSKRGIPEGLEGLPVEPAQKSQACLQQYGGAWHLSMKRTGCAKRSSTA